MPKVLFARAYNIPIVDLKWTLNPSEPFEDFLFTTKSTRHLFKGHYFLLPARISGIEVKFLAQLINQCGGITRTGNDRAIRVVSK